MENTILFHFNIFKSCSISSVFCALLLIISSVCADESWTVSTIDDTYGSGKYSSLAIIDDRPAIAYRYNDARSALKYARFNGSEWEITTIEESPVQYTQYVEYLSLAQMPDGNPAIAFFDYITSDLRFLRYDGSGWTSTTIDSTGTTGRCTSLCVINGQPAISYLDSNNDLKYVRYDGTSWQMTIIDAEAAYSTDAVTSLKAQSNGYPAIAYYANKLKYAAFDGTNWNLSTVDNTSYTGRSASLAFGIDGNPAISYYYYLDKNLMFASFDGTQWNTQQVVAPTVYANGQYSSLAFLPSGIPILSWYQRYSSGSYYVTALNFSWLDNGQWNHSTIDGGVLNDKGKYASMAILDDYSLGVAYYDAKNYYLDFAKTAYPLTAADPDIHYIATAWSQHAGEETGIDESAGVSDWFCGESGSVQSYVEVGSTLPGAISATITLSGRACYEGECIEWGEDDCLRWGQCLLWDEETWECLQWQEGLIFVDPNDTSGRLQTQIEIDPTTVMPLGAEVYLHILLNTTVEDPGASETRYCKIYINSVLVEELTSDTEMYIPALVGDTFDIDVYYLVESDGDYYHHQMSVLLNITDEEGEIIQTGSPDICGQNGYNPDGIVDLLDFKCLAIEWLNSTCTPEQWCNNADIDRSGAVDILDFALLASAWLWELPM